MINGEKIMDVFPDVYFMYSENNDVIYASIDGVHNHYFDTDWWNIEYKGKTGHWIDEGQYAEGHSHHAYECSECGNHIIELKPDDFCKFCGADMRESDNKC